jgi:hypothetical protein
MAFLSDLDLLSWAATVAAVTLSSCVAFLVLRDWKNGWAVSFEGPAPLTVLFGLLCLVGAAKSYSPDQNAPRKQVEGVARFVHEVSGKGGHTVFICATSCQLTGGYALALQDEATNYVEIGSRYTFTYLEHPNGNAFTGVSLRVIQVADADSGRVLYALDLTNHPYRISIYVLDSLILFCPFVLALKLAQKQDRLHRLAKGPRDSEDENPSDEASEEKSPDLGPISLQLESKDAN